MESKENAGKNVACYKSPLGAIVIDSESELNAVYAVLRQGLT